MRLTDSDESLGNGRSLRIALKTLFSAAAVLAIFFLSSSVTRADNETGNRDAVVLRILSAPNALVTTEVLQYVLGLQSDIQMALLGSEHAKSGQLLTEYTGLNSLEPRERNMPLPPNLKHALAG